jgi:hypothetical protein
MTTATASRNRYEAFARERKVTEMAQALLRGHAHLLAGSSFVAVVEAALASACGFTAADWVELHEATGRKGAPSDITTAAVLEHLEGLLPTPATTGPTFEGLPR